MKVYSPEEIKEKLTPDSGWEFQQPAITKLFIFPEFTDGIRFVNKIADAAEEADHHPDIDIRYRKVRISLATHSEGGVTDKDFNLARQIDSTADQILNV